eukprot:TRINITY_DN7489_c0_g1_i1.p1 TRINITY_DN7489_c0_g1~~TRINITY_DN7489_c0_g1_i1.p1  ORF type:complete len:547 (+),score=177.95 TRINITY_DN7489_c0_g1_i1:85-1725(+)
MAMHIPKVGLQTMMKDGAKHYSGLEEAVYRNIGACKEIANIVRTSFGPNGMNKMIVNHLDKLFVTNDAATIIRELEVEHPAAKMIILASQQQEHEAGDATNFVIILAGKLLEKAEALLRMGVAVVDVINGFEQAIDKATEILPSLVAHTVDNLREKEQTVTALSTCLASKQAGYEEFLAKLITDACVDVLPKEKTRKAFNVDNVRVCKILGSGVLTSRVVRGIVFIRSAAGIVTQADNAKIAAYTADVDYTFTETKGTVLIQSADELKKYSKEEEAQLEEQIQAIIDAGVNVIVTTGKVGDMALHFCNRKGLMVVKINSKYELRRLCRATRTTALPRLTPPSAQEMGHCDHVELDEIGDTTVTIFRQDDLDSAVSTIIVRGATDNIMDDIERAIDDGVNNFKALTRDQRYVPGAGATEIELALQLAQYGEQCAGLEQYAIKAFAEALEVIPHTLAENAGGRAKEVVSKLYAAHQGGDKNVGLDNETDNVGVKDVAEAKILDHMMTKHWAMVYATRAACTVLRVDQIIMAKKAGGPKAPKQPQYDED